MTENNVKTENEVKWRKMKLSDRAWRGVMGNDGVWRVVMGGDGVMECPDTLEQGGPMEFGTEFGTEVQSEIWYMTVSHFGWTFASHSFQLLAG